MNDAKHEMVRADIKPLTPAEIKAQVNAIGEVMKAVMKEGTHYDAIPGTGKYEYNPVTKRNEYVKGKPVLLKPGAEKILATFHIGVETSVEDLGDGFDFRYRVTCRGFFIPTGNTVGYGIGEASTSEKKYKWREAVCQEEFDDTPEDRRQILYKKEKTDKGTNVVKIMQVRQNPADIANTCLKMAKKRAMVDLCLTATACSDIFVQDIDDPDTAAGAGVDTPPKQPNFQRPERKAPEAAASPAGNAPASDGVISEAQRKRLYAIGKQKGLSDEEMQFIVFDIAGVDRSADIPREKYEATVSAIETAEPGKVLPA